MKLLKYIIFSLALAISLKGGEVIESLPTREKAEMNIEVTKIFTEKIVASHDEDLKTITLDFKNSSVDQSLYEIFLFEDLNTLPSYSVSNGRGRVFDVIKNGAKLRAGSKVTSGKLTYFLDRAKSTPTLNIQYEEKPNKIYIGVLNKSTNNVAKIFYVEYDTPQSYAGAITHFYNGIPNKMSFNDNGDSVDSTHFYWITHSSTSDISMDNHGQNTTFRLSAIIGGSSLGDSSGNTIVNGVVTNFIQPQIKVGDETLPIKLNLGSIVPSGSNLSTFTHKMHPKDSSSIIAARSSNLALKVKLELSIDPDIIKAARKVNLVEVPFEWITSNGQKNQVAFPKADWQNGGSIPHSENNRTEIAPYPALSIIKNSTTHAGSINFSTYTSSTINPQDNLFFKGLKYSGFIKIYKNSSDTTPLVESKISGNGVSDGGDTDEMNFNLTNSSGNSLSFKLKFEKGEPKYELVSFTQSDYTKESETDRSFEFVMKQHEESTLLRKTDTVKIIAPKMQHTMSNNIPSELIFYDNGENITNSYNNAIVTTTTDGLLVSPAGDLRYVLDNIPNSYPNYFPVISLYNADTATPFGDSNLGENSKSLTADNYFKVILNGIEKEIGAYLYFGQDSYASVRSTYSKYNLTPFERVQKYGGTGKILKGFMNGGFIKPNYVSTLHSARAGTDSYPIFLRVNLTKDVIASSREVNKKDITLPYTSSTYKTVNFILGKRETTQSNENSNTFVYLNNVKASTQLPSLKIVKNQILRDMSIDLSLSYNRDFIDFDANGSTSSSGITLSNGFNMKGLPFKHNILINDKYSLSASGTDITGGGNTSETAKFELTGTNGTKANFELTYRTDGLPSLAIKSWFGKDTFKFNVKHDELSGLNRREYNITVNTPDTNKLNFDASGILNSSTYNDTDNRNKSFAPGDFDVFSGGTLKATLSNYIDGYFPALTLGNATSITNPNNALSTRFNKLKLIYKNLEFETRIHFWTINSPPSTTFYSLDTYDENLNKELIVGKFKNNDTALPDLTISTNLRLNLTKDSIIQIRKSIPEKSIELKPKDSTNDVITATIGTQNNPDNFTVDSSTTPNFKYKYPTIIFEKDQPIKSAHITLETNYIKGSIIQFDVNGKVSNSATGVTSANLPPGLSFGGSYEIYQDGTLIDDRIATNGENQYTGAGDTTASHSFTLKDNVKISLKHNPNGLIDFSLDEWSTDAEVDFKIVYYEGSGLMRQTTVVKLITPRIASEVSKGVLDFGVIL
ncbi:MAG: hypothetical protein ACRCZO_10490, partial [Cetobacterium sp.]